MASFQLIKSTIMAAIYVHYQETRVKRLLPNEIVTLKHPPIPQFTPQVRVIIPSFEIIQLWHFRPKRPRPKIIAPYP
jgi:hypothetical protein